MPKYGQKHAKNLKNIFIEVLCTSSDFIRFYLIFWSNPSKKVLLAGEHRMVEDGGGWWQGGENVLAGEHQFYLLEMLLMKFCSVRNQQTYAWTTVIL